MSPVPYTVYNVWLKAFTRLHEGSPSSPLQVVTDVSGPGRPAITNLTCVGDNSLHVEWMRPDQFHQSVDQYNVYYSNRRDVWDLKQIYVTPTQNQLSLRVGDLS